MKKLFMFVMAAAALTFAACGNKTAEGACEDSLCCDSAACLSEECDPVAALSAAVESQDAGKVQSLLDAAKEKLNSLSAEEKAEYASKLQEFVETNKEKIEAVGVSTATVSSVIEAVKNLPTTVEGVANDAADAAKADAKNATQEAEKAAVDKANEVVNDAASKAASKASDAINDAASKLNSKLGK